MTATRTTPARKTVWQTLCSSVLAVAMLAAVAPAAFAQDEAGKSAATLTVGASVVKSCSLSTTAGAGAQDASLRCSTDAQAPTVVYADVLPAGSSTTSHDDLVVTVLF